ncbi:HNH endonuclease [Paenibacillus polymyxa]|uniref:Predicted restriction endonuclease n=1 Tax=Paenibacillus polymyxa TaxID=1406 RepID=A0A378Y1X1_PAEPO|nr:HNH endonuclease [Paenibacillus polymyxa]MBE7896962.1 HNH endonuclease [Paenibacillus polymyxa]MBG9767397.1 restriction endonuclease [Paenibacillus polymyxa]MCC3258826.1 HNH endonuclease [Paenibacillus polymyxa]MDN4086192.1 HNH endonuclease [Paenibacillus polymyxa]MDN4088514.1 HNH endonuclease [Paenibacillus polymyxa]
MNNTKSWLEEIIEALNELGGEGTLLDIYTQIEDRKQMELTKAWKNTVRRTIYDNTKDSVGRRDVFYSVEGKGNGIWGLKDFEANKENIEITEDDTGFPEGKKKLRLHLSRERRPAVVREAKKIFKEKNGGNLFCEICGFNFSSVYGELGEDFIEGHHVIPVSELNEDHKTKVEDIAMVCSNCHRMLHRRRPWLTKDKLRDLIKHLAFQEVKEHHIT